MNIVFCAWRDLAHPQAGGAEILVDRLARGLAGRGHRVALMCGGPVASRPYQVVDLGGTYSQYARAPVAHRRSFADWDLLVDTENGIPFFSPLWRRRAILCLVHHVHTEQWADRFPPPLAAVGRSLESQLMPRCYRGVPFVAVSPSTAESLSEIGVAPEQIAVAALNAVPATPAAPAPRSPEPLFVALGRLVPHKRTELLLRLWPEVRRHTGGRLVVIGDGPERGHLTELLSEGAELVGKVSEERKAELLARAWLLLHPAHHEGFGLVVLEAGALETPALAFDVPGLRDVIVDGLTGYLATSEQQFLERWIEIGTRSGPADELARGARHQASRFSVTRAVDRFEQVAAEVVRSWPGGTSPWSWGRSTLEALGDPWLPDSRERPPSASSAILRWPSGG